MISQANVTEPARTLPTSSNSVPLLIGSSPPTSDCVPQFSGCSIVTEVDERRRLASMYQASWNGLLKKAAGYTWENPSWLCKRVYVDLYMPIYAHGWNYTTQSTVYTSQYYTTDLEKNIWFLNLDRFWAWASCLVRLYNFFWAESLNLPCRDSWHDSKNYDDDLPLWSFWMMHNKKMTEKASLEHILTFSTANVSSTPRLDRISACCHRNDIHKERRAWRCGIPCSCPHAASPILRSENGSCTTVCTALTRWLHWRCCRFHEVN